MKIIEILELNAVVQREINFNFLKILISWSLQHIMKYMQHIKSILDDLILASDFRM